MNTPLDNLANVVFAFIEKEISANVAEAQIIALFPSIDVYELDRRLDRIGDIDTWVVLEGIAALTRQS